MAADTKGNVYVLTSTGLNEIKFIRQYLFPKSKLFSERYPAAAYPLWPACRNKNENTR